MYIFLSILLFTYNTIPLILVIVCLCLAVSMVLDSLDDIHCLQEPPPGDREFLHSILEDRQLHALLEVCICKSKVVFILKYLYIYIYVAFPLNIFYGKTN